MGEKDMNDPLDLVERLAARARREAPEPADVAGEVLKRLHAPARTPLGWVAVCAVAAAVVLVAAAGTAGESGDALDAVFEAASFIEPEGGF